MSLHLQLNPGMYSFPHDAKCLLPPNGMMNVDDDISEMKLQI